MPTDYAEPAPRHAAALGAQAARGLALHARTLTRGPLGAKLGKDLGESIEFMDYREYQPGDDLRRIDWAAFSRSDKLMIRRHREEVSPFLDVAIDDSASMHLPGSPKAHCAIAAAALIARAAAAGGLNVRLLAAGAQPRVIERRGEPDHADWPDFDDKHHAPPRVHDHAAAKRTRGMRVFISDLLFHCDPLRFARSLAAGASQLLILRVVSQHDLQPDFLGGARLRDRETGRLVLIELDRDGQRRFHNRVEAHRTAHADAARRVGALFLELVAENTITPQRGFDATPLLKAGLLVPE